MDSTKKFNRLLDSFLKDLVSTVPDSVPLVEASNWMSGIVALDPSNTKIAECFVEKGIEIRDLIRERNVSVFSECLPSEIISMEDMAYVYQSLSAEDRQVCWKYIVKLYKSARRVLEDLGFAETEEDKVAWRECLEVATGPINIILDSFMNGDYSAIEIPSGPMAMRALDLLLEQYSQTMGELGIELTPCAKEGERALGYIGAQYGGPKRVVQILTHAEKVLEKKGVPLSAARGKEGGKLFSMLGEDEKDRAKFMTMQLASICYPLLLIDADVLEKVENKLREIMLRIKNGEINIKELFSMDEETFDPIKTMSKISDLGLVNDFSRCFVR